MADRYARPYLDAQSWITALSGSGPYAEDVRAILAAADRAELTVVTSVLMPLEVLGGRRDSRTLESSERVLQALSRSNVIRVAVTDAIVRDARGLRLEHGLDTIDALHVASAVAGNADALLSNDDEIVRLGQYRGVPILRPVWPGDVPFPELAE